MRDGSSAFGGVCPHLEGFFAPPSFHAARFARIFGYFVGGVYVISVTGDGGFDPGGGTLGDVCV